MRARATSWGVGTASAFIFVTQVYRNSTRPGVPAYHESSVAAAVLGKRFHAPCDPA